MGFGLTIRVLRSRSFPSFGANISKGFLMLITLKQLMHAVLAEVETKKKKIVVSSQVRLHLISQVSVRMKKIGTGTL